MDDLQSGEPLEEMMSVVTQRSPDFTPVMLKKWRDAGLIPSPVRRPGRGKAQGRTAVYPDGTTAQLLRILDMREEPGRFNVDRARWRLWWEGWEISDSHIRTSMLQQLNTWRVAISRLSELQESIDNDPEALSPFTDRRMPYRLLGQMKRRSSDHFEDIAMLVMSLMSGEGSQWFSDSAGTGESAEDLRITSRAFGIKALTTGMTVAQQEEVAAQLMDSFERFSSLIGPGRIEQSLSQATDEDLRAACQELKSLASALSVFNQTLKHLVGGNSTIFDMQQDWSASETELVQGALLLWLALRNAPGYQGIARFASDRNQIGQLAALLSSLVLGHKVPPRRVQPSGGSAQGVQSQCAKSLPPDSFQPPREVAS